MFSNIVDGKLIKFDERDLINGHFDVPNSVTSIGDGAFYNCGMLTSVTIPESVTSIGGYVFYDCIRLTSVTIPESVTSIGFRMFTGCISLTSVTIPESVTSVGSYAFSGCRSLTSVIIPNSVTSIGWCVFSNCRNLTSVTIPNSVTSIGWDVFSNCRSLTSINTSERIAKDLDLDEFVNVKTENATSFAGLFKLQAQGGVKQFDTATAKAILKRPEFKKVDSQTDLFNLMYNLGIFEKKDRKLSFKTSSGKNIEQKISDVGFNIIQQMFSVGDEGKLSPNELHLYFQSMKRVGINEEFLRFLSNKTNLTEIIEQEKNQNGYIARVLDWFEFRKSLTNLGEVEGTANTSTTPTSER